MQKELPLQNNRSSDRKSALFTFFVLLVIAIAVMRIVFNVIYFKVYVVGDSMKSTLNGVASEIYSGGDYVYAFRGQNPRHGDIVVIKTEEKNIIKRVIALGGDCVELKDGVLYLNDKIKEEPYVLDKYNTPSENNYERVRVPEGCMFCLGDNRDNSQDSRSEKYGFFSVSNTIGIVADWSLSCKKTLTAVNTFFDYTVPEALGLK